MTKKVIMLIVVVILSHAMFTLTEAQAQGKPLCGKRADMLKEVYKYRELPTIRAIAKGKEWMLEVWANRSTGTWTLLRTNTKGMTCFIVAGDSYMEMPIPKTGKGS